MENKRGWYHTDVCIEMFYGKINWILWDCQEIFLLQKSIRDKNLLLGGFVQKNINNFLIRNIFSNNLIVLGKFSKFDVTCKKQFLCFLIIKLT